MKRIGLFCISSLFLFVQFAYAKEYRLKSQFDPASVQWSKTTGNAAVAGMGIYRLSDGTMKSCAGQTVYYYPYSDYVMEQLQFRMRGITNIKNLNPQSVQYRFSVTCDQEGDFHIAYLPAGKWIFVMNIPVVKNDEDYSSYNQESDLSGVAGEGNGIIYRIVTLTPQKVTQVPLIQGDVNSH